MTAQGAVIELGVTLESVVCAESIGFLFCFHIRIVTDDGFTPMGSFWGFLFYVMDLSNIWVSLFLGDIFLCE